MLAHVDVKMILVQYITLCARKKCEVSDVSLIGDAPPNKEEQGLIE